MVMATTSGLSDRCLENATPRPEGVQSARNDEAAPGSDISLEGLAVIADSANGARGPIRLQPRLLSELPFAADQADVGVRRFQRVVDVSRFDAERRRPAAPPARAALSKSLPECAK